MLGDAAVSANIVSPVLIIIVAFTGICSFSIPDFSLSFTLRIFKFLYIFLGYLFGFLGIAIGISIQLSILSNLHSFGVPYLSPYTPISNSDSNTSFFQNPIWKREYRADFLNTKRPMEAAHISRKWKFNNKKE
ncbi:MAG: spore germination protein [Clostridia bacterium]